MMATKKDNKKYQKLRDSFQDIRVNDILDKILFKQKLDKEDNDYLNNFDKILSLDLKDYSHISKNLTYELVQSFLSKNIKVICDLEDRNGKFNDEIISLENNFMSSKCKLFLKHGEECYLEDRFLYNLFYKIKNNHYSLTAQDEYFEKIMIDKDEN
jgi:hypothetical protein